MPKVKKKISYIKKPFSRKSFISVGFAAAALICCGFSLGLSVSHQGNGGLNVAAWGLSSLIFSLIGGFYGLIFLYGERKKLSFC